IGGPISVPLGSFTDAAAPGPFLVDINWGDGTPDSVLSLSSAGLIPRRNHTFLKAGNVQVSVSVTDASANSSNVATFSVSVLGYTTENLVVNTVADQMDPRGSATMSLRDAINIADASFATVNISFDSNVFASRQIIQLSDNWFNSPLELAGNSAGTIIIITGPAAGLSIRADESLDAVFRIARGTTASISGVIINGGGTRGAIYCEGNLTLANCDVFDNQMTSGVNNQGTMTLINCTVAGNRAHDVGA